MHVNRAATMLIESIQSDSPVREAALKMKDLNVGLLLVANGHQLVGVITDRDIVTRSVATGACVCKSVVRDIMSSPVACIPGDASLDEAARMMSEKQVRRLVVTNSESVPVGVFSIDDLAFSTHGDATAAQVLEVLAHGPQSAAIYRAGT